MKVLSFVICVLGVIAVGIMVTSEGLQGIFDLLSRVGWRLLILPFLRLVPLYLDVMGWRLLLPPRISLLAMLRIAAIREAINKLLPAANIGGEVVGIALLRRQGTAVSVATASVIVELLLTMFSQVVFALFGLVGLYYAAGNTTESSAFVLALSASLPVLILITALLAKGSLFQRIERIAARIFHALGRNSDLFGNWALVDQAIRQLIKLPLSLLRAVSWQLSGHAAACLETWLILRWLGVPAPLVAAIAIESLTQAIRSLFFIVPGGLGVQEASLIGIGHLLHFDPSIALALSLAKRCREVLFGLPALGLWQMTELRGAGRALPTGER